MNKSYFAKGSAHVKNTNLHLHNLEEAVKIVNQFAKEKNLSQLMLPAITGLDQSWMNAAHKQWVRYTDELCNIVNGDDTKIQYPEFSVAWQSINTYIHTLEDYYSVYFTNTKGAYLKKIDVKIRPEDCEYSQHDLVLSFQDLGRHQFNQWVTGSTVDAETSNYKTISARFEYTYYPQLTEGAQANPNYVRWCNENNLEVLPPWIILGNFKKNKWEIRKLMHQNLSRGLEVGFEL